MEKSFIIFVFYFHCKKKKKEKEKKTASLLINIWKTFVLQSQAVQPTFSQKDIISEKYIYFNMYINMYSKCKVKKKKFSLIVILHDNVVDQFVFCSCGSVVDYCISSAKGCGFNSQGTHILIKKCIAWMQCKSLWIKVSAKCINVKMY